jgi:hypothetical protein
MGYLAYQIFDHIPCERLFKYISFPYAMVSVKAVGWQYMRYIFELG